MNKLLGLPALISGQAHGTPGMPGAYVGVGHARLLPQREQNSVLRHESRRADSFAAAAVLLLSMPFPVAAEQGRMLDHSAWNEILKTYVSSESAVDYSALKERGVAPLDS